MITNEISVEDTAVQYLQSKKFHLQLIVNLKTYSLCILSFSADLDKYQTLNTLPLFDTLVNKAPPLFDTWVID